MAIDMKRRMLYIPVLHIDTNLINARQKLDAVNQLERWAENVCPVHRSSCKAQVARLACATYLSLA